jgi:hypothetical protein
MAMDLHRTTTLMKIHRVTEYKESIFSEPGYGRHLGTQTWENILS